MQKLPKSNRIFYRLLNNDIFRPAAQHFIWKEIFHTKENLFGVWAARKINLDGILFRQFSQN